MSKPISLVMAYYENPTMLRMQYERIAALPPEIRGNMHVVIVDDGSPSPNEAKPPDFDIGVPMQLYRIGVDIRWNQDAARNIGVRHSEVEWCLLTDMDHIVPESTWRGIMRAELDLEKVYTFRRVEAPAMTPEKHHPNSWLLTRRVFDRIGGYDERFAGVYGSDGDFRNRLREDHELVEIKEHLERYPRSVVADASTTRYLRKQPEDLVGKKRVWAEREAAGGKDGKAWLPLRYMQPYELVWRTGGEDERASAPRAQA